MVSSKRDKELTPQEQQAIRATLPSDAPDLGAIHAVYHRRKAGPVTFFFSCGLGIALAILLLVVALSKPPQSDDRVPLFIMAGASLVAGLAAGGWGVLLTRQPWRSATENWVVCEDGLLRHQGEQLDVFAWDKLKIRKTVAHPYNRRYELSGHGGDGPIPLKFGPIGAGLIHIIEKTQVRRARPGLLRAITAGETVRFGKLGVNAQGLVYRKEGIPWDNVKSLDFSYDQQKTQQLFLTIPVRGGADIVLNASEDLPNIWLFMEVVSQVHPRLKKYKDSQDTWLL